MTFSLTENQFSGKTNLYTLHPCMITGGVAAAAVRFVLSSNNFEAGDVAASSFKNLD